MEMTVKSKSLRHVLGRFFGNAANFRLILFITLFCDFRYLLYPLYMTLIGLLTVWSLGLMIREMYCKQRIMRVKFRRIIFVFLIFAAFSVVLHSEINLLQNLLTLHWIAVCFFLLYGIHAEKSNNRVRKEMKRLFDVLIVMTNVIMLVGLILFMIFPKGIRLMGYDFCIIEGRFVGIIPNANVTAFYAVMSIILSVLMLRIRRADDTAGYKRKFWYIGGIVLNSLVLILTDSNASVVFLIVFLSFLFFYEMFKEFNRKKLHTFIFRLAAAALSAVIVVTSILFIRVNVQNGVSAVLASRESDIVISTDLDANNDNIRLDKAEISKKPANAEKAIGHQNTNIDSGRFVLWRQALGLIELYPLFGIGKDNITDYGVNYLGGIRYTDLAGYHYVDFHNGLLTIAVSFGIVGLSLFLVMALTIAKSVLRCIFRHKIRSRRDGNALVILAAFCAGYCVYSMFEAALFTDYTYRVCIFWLLLGFAMSYVMKYHWQGLHSKIDPLPLMDDTSEWHYIRSKIRYSYQKIRATASSSKNKVTSAIKKPRKDELPETPEDTVSVEDDTKASDKPLSEKDNETPDENQAKNNLSEKDSHTPDEHPTADAEPIKKNSKKRRKRDKQDAASEVSEEV